MTRKKVVLYHCISFLPSILLYRFLILRTMPISFETLMFWGIVAILVFIAVALQIKCFYSPNWTWREIGANYIVAYGLLSCLFQWREYPRMTPFLLTLSFLAFIGATAYLFRGYKPIDAREVFQTLAENLRLGLLVGLLLLLTYIMVKNFLAVVTESVAKPVSAGGEIIAEEGKEYLSGFREESWKEMSESDRLSLLRRVAEEERAWLGISQEIELVAEELEYGRLGSYDRANLRILLNTQHMGDPAEDVVETLCHEMYHAYQYCLLEAYLRMNVKERDKTLLLFRKLETYQEELETYADGTKEENLEEYYRQEWESDARSYAAQRMIYYYYPYIHSASEESR